MVRVAKIVLDKNAHDWLLALVSLNKRQRKETLGKFCSLCGVEYRHLYAVLDGRSAISEELLNALKHRAIVLGIESEIETKMLENNLGIESMSHNPGLKTRGLSW